jgi:signal transduction histidine kinase
MPTFSALDARTHQLDDLAHDGARIAALQPCVALTAAQAPMLHSCGLSSNTQSVVIGVRDYRAGVPEHQLSSVFEPFFRGESELNRRNQGTGLGLALVRDLGALMKGSVQGRNRGPGFELLISLHVP